MNIRVDLETPITDGREVVFRSPVDCSQVTGLILYYNGESKEFAFADAHGNNVGDIDHLFAENVVVKVILDLRTNMAFVQNADTNAYLEGRFAALEEAIATGGGSVDLSNYYDKEFIDLVIEDADRRLTNLEGTASKAVDDFEIIVPPLVEAVEDLSQRVSAIEDNVYDGSYTDIEAYDGSVTKGVL